MEFGLRNAADVRTLCFTGIFFGLMWLNWKISDLVPPVLMVPLFATECLFSFFGAVSVHNAIHTPVFKDYGLNKLFQIVLTCTYGHPVTCFVPGHNLSHHHHTQQPEDLMRTTKLRFKWHLLNGLFFFLRIGVDMLGTEGAYFEVQKKRGHPIYKQMIREKTCLYTMYAVLAILNWKKFLVFCILPHTFAKFCIITLNLLQHDGTDDKNPYNSGRNFTGPILNYLCFNNGFHTIHHMHPGVHWSETKALHYKEVAPHMDPALDEPNILTYIFRTFVFPGIRVHYSGKPLVLPPAVPDKPWFYSSNETYSNYDKHEEAPPKKVE